MEILAFLANLGSLVGLAATMWTAWRAYQSKKYYQLVGRVPGGIEQLQNGTRDLAKANDAREQRLALGEIRNGLESVARNIGSNKRRAFDVLAHRVGQVEQDAPPTPDQIDDIYVEAERLAGQAESLVEDEKFLRSP